MSWERAAGASYRAMMSREPEPDTAADAEGLRMSKGEVACAGAAEAGEVDFSWKKSSSSGKEEELEVLGALLDVPPNSKSGSKETGCGLGCAGVGAGTREGAETECVGVGGLLLRSCEKASSSSGTVEAAGATLRAAEPSAAGRRRAAERGEVTAEAVGDVTGVGGFDVPSSLYHRFRSYLSLIKLSTRETGSSSLGFMPAGRFASHRAFALIFPIAFM